MVDGGGGAGEGVVGGWERTGDSGSCIESSSIELEP